MVIASDIERVVADVLPLVIETRRAIHQHPELAHQEFTTTDRLATALREAGIEPRPRTPKTGLIVDIDGDGPRVAFRADIDALPITEPAGLPFASQTPGLMHACGHDAHAAIALGVTIAASRLDLPGSLRVLFQPAEESFPGGARELIREKVMEGVSSIVAFHVDPSLQTGLVGFKSGAITSSADRFYITLEGPGGHTARPHKTVDLIGAAAQVVTHLPSLLQRRIDARSPLVVVFGRINSGTADNVIPTLAELSGTVRTADRSLWDDIPSMIDKLVGEIIAPFGASGIVHYQRGLPPVVNHPEVVSVLEAATATAMGPRCPTPTHVSMGAEDFARYLEVAPGALLRLGCAESDASTDLHSASFRLDEAALEVGLKVALNGLVALMSSPPLTPAAEIPAS